MTNNPIQALVGFVLSVVTLTLIFTDNQNAQLWVNALLGYFAATVLGSNFWNFDE